MKKLLIFFVSILTISTLVFSSGSMGISMGMFFACCIGCALLTLIIKLTLQNEKGIYFYINNPFSEITPSYFILHNKKIFWKDVDFVHFTDSFNRGFRRHRPLSNYLYGGRTNQTLLIFIKGKRFPYLINLIRLENADSKAIITAFNQYNTRIDLWHNKLQRWIWY